MRPQLPVKLQYIQVVTHSSGAYWPVLLLAAPEDSAFSRLAVSIVAREIALTINLSDRPMAGPKYREWVTLFRSAWTVAHRLLHEKTAQHRQCPLHIG